MIKFYKQKLKATSNMGRRLYSLHILDFWWEASWLENYLISGTTYQGYGYSSPEMISLVTYMSPK